MTEQLAGREWENLEQQFGRLTLLFSSPEALRDAVNAIRNYGVVSPCLVCSAFVLPDETCGRCGTVAVCPEE